MRLRKIRGRSAFPVNQPRLSARPQLESLTGQRSQNLFRTPNSNSPVHPSVLRHVVGLYKYTTGVIFLPEWLRQQTRLARVALKIYSQEPIREVIVKQALRSALKQSNPSGSLRSRLKQAFEIASAVSSSSAKFSDVYFQVFERIPSTRAIVGSQPAFAPRTRLWNLVCQLYQGNGRDATPSKPLGEINLPDLYLHGSAKLQNGYRTVERLQLKVYYHLKAQIWDAHPDGTQSLSDIASKQTDMPLQTFVDGALAACKQAVGGQVFVDGNEMASAVKDSLSAYLRSSPLAYLVDFHNLEVIALNSRDERFVTNALLNADGSERTLPNASTGNSELQPTSVGTFQATSSADTGDAKARTEQFGKKNEMTATDWRRHQLSKDTQQKSGCSAIVEIRRGLAPYQSQSIGGPESTELVIREFDDLFNVVPELGLPSIAHAIALLAAKYPDIDIRVNTNRLKLEYEPAGLPTMHEDDETATIKFSCSNRYHEISVTLPVLVVPGVRLSLTSNALAYSASCHVGVTLHGQYREPESGETLDQPPLSVSTAEEIVNLTLMTSTVVAGITKDITFSSYEEIPRLLAEGVSRTLQFLSPLLSLQKVKVKVRTLEDSTVGRYELEAVQWVENKDPPVSHELVLPHNQAHTPPEISHQAVTPKGTTAHGEAQATTHPEDGTFEDIDPSRTPEDSIQEDTPAERYTRRKEGPLSSSIQRKFGFDFVSIVRTDRAPASSFDEVQSLLEHALEATSGSSLGSIQQAMRSIEANLPQNSVYRVYITMKRYLPPAELCDIVRNSPTAKFTIWNDVATHTFGRSVSFALPSIKLTSFQVDGSDWTSNTQLHLYVSVDGKFSEGDEDHQTTDVTTQVNSMLHTIHNISAPILRGTTFSTLADLIERLASLLIDQRHLFSDIIDMQAVRLTIKRKKGLKILQSVRRSAVTTPDTELPSELQEGDSDDAEGEALREKAVIALGSNMGDRLQNIENACRVLEADPDIRILQTSPLYETAPMYYEDQDLFLNGVCEIETLLQPMGLLDRLQAVEQHLGRVKTIEKGPRNIDLDILVYGDQEIQTERLTIPHPLMHEREFVLRPLRDLRIVRSQHHPTIDKPYYELLKPFQEGPQSMHAVTTLATGRGEIRGNSKLESTRIMSIVNVTPDSFSDGGTHRTTNLEEFVSFVKAQIAEGATIIDIGGQSSRPNAPDVSAEDEIARIVPAIEAVRSIPEAASVAISIDTYRAAVADAAIKAGAHIINDISAGLLDEDMLPTIARLGCTYIMMHMRGTPATMMSEENCSYPNGLLPTIASELEARVTAAQEAGIRRWRIILDPGIGFSKTVEQNVSVLRDFQALKKDFRVRNFAWLVGSSRKSFIGKITGVEDPKQRSWGTAATVTAAIRGGADIVRVHDAAEMSAVVKMSDAISRV